MKNLVKINLSIFALLLGHLSAHAGDSPFYKNEIGRFSLRPSAEGRVFNLTRFGPVGLSGGYRLYVNGKLFYEDTSGVDRRGGGKPEGRIIPTDWWPEFEGPVTLSAITFKKNHPRTKKFGVTLTSFYSARSYPRLSRSLQKCRRRLPIADRWIKYNQRNI